MTDTMLFIIATAAIHILSLGYLISGAVGYWKARHVLDKANELANGARDQAAEMGRLNSQLYSEVLQLRIELADERGEINF